MKLEGKQVLVVDDDPDMAAYLTAILRDQGVECSTARDGVEGMDMVRSSPPDLVCLDLSMPEKTGIRMFKELRRDQTDHERHSRGHRHGTVSRFRNLLLPAQDRDGTGGLRGEAGQRPGVPLEGDESLDRRIAGQRASRPQTMKKVRSRGSDFFLSEVRLPRRIRRSTS